MLIMAKDFHNHVGKSILMPHPTIPLVLPRKIKIVGARKKKVTLRDEESGQEMTANYSQDKTKYKVIE